MRVTSAARRVFEDGDVAAERGGHRHALRPSQFEHALHVLAEERRFERHLTGGVLVDERPHAVEDAAQFGVGIRQFVEIDGSHDHRAQFAPRDLHDAVTHVVGSGVDSHDAVGLFVRCRHFGRYVIVRAVFRSRRRECARLGPMAFGRRSARRSSGSARRRGGSGCRSCRSRSASRRDC